MDSDEERNYYRLLLLLLKVGTPKLRDYFIRKWNSAAGHRPWSDCPQDGADLTLMWKPKIHPYENAKVTSGDTSTWDLSLFVNILSPNEPRRGMRRALDKLKDLRNSLCHSSEAKLTNRDFQRKWNDACNALILFGAMSEDFKSVKRDAKKSLKDLKPVVVKWLAHEFELLHNGQLQLLQKFEKVGEAQITLHDEIQQCQNVILCELKEMQHATAEGTRPDSANHLIFEPRVTNQSTENEGEVYMLAKYLKGYYQTGERSILPPLPWMEGDQFNIENIYTTTKIVEMNTKHVTPIQGIFLKAATDPKNIRRILIEGEPRIGKSAICKKIAYDWSMNKLFPAFEVVLSLKCRDFHTGSDLWDAIEMQNFSDCLKEKRTDIFKYIKSNQSKVLLVLDGYDEIPDKCAGTMKQSIDRLIRGQLLPDCSVIVTSRPGKSSGIRKHFDRKLEIKGFELNDSFMFIKRFFVSSPETSEAAVSFIKRCEAAKDLVRNPFNTAILCLQKKNRNEELSISILTKEINFSIIKRYCVEKFGEEVNDDDIASVVREKLYKLGKMAFILTKFDRGNVVGENELQNTVNSTGLIAFLVAFLCGIVSWIRKLFRKESLGDKVDDYNLIREFLVYEQPVDTIRTTPCYTFPHASLKEDLAADYVKESFRKNYFMEWICILAFKNLATFLRVIWFIHVVLKRCLEDKSLKWMDIVGYLLSLPVFVFHFGNIAYKNWIY